MDLGFTSIMIDCSTLPYEENVAATARVTAYAHSRGVDVESELGSLPQREGGGDNGSAPAKPEDLYTKPELVPDYLARTGVDALAIAFGTAHGFYNAQPKLDFDVVKNVKAATGLPLVMHGGSGVSEEGFKQAIANGIRKINYYSYMSKAGYEAAKAEIEAGNSKYLHDVEFAAMKAMKEDVKNAIRVFANLK
jgi:fructose-bisphosphate aldolase class II